MLLKWSFNSYNKNNVTLSILPNTNMSEEVIYSMLHFYTRKTILESTEKTNKKVLSKHIIMIRKVYTKTSNSSRITYNFVSHSSGSRQALLSVTVRCMHCTNSKVFIFFLLLKYFPFETCKCRRHESVILVARFHFLFRQITGSTFYKSWCSLLKRQTKIQLWEMMRETLNFSYTYFHQFVNPLILLQTNSKMQNRCTNSLMYLYLW